MLKSTKTFLHFLVINIKICTALGLHMAITNEKLPCLTNILQRNTVNKELSFFKLIIRIAYRLSLHWTFAVIGLMH